MCLSELLLFSNLRDFLEYFFIKSMRIQSKQEIGSGCELLKSINRRISP